MELYEDIYNKKFSFGKNWQLFLKNLDDNKNNLARKSLGDFTKLNSFKGKTFIDFGCGSGLFSLCAVQLGSKKVISIDIDDNSLNCTKFLKYIFYVVFYNYFKIILFNSSTWIKIEKFNLELFNIRKTNRELCNKYFI